MQVTIEVNTKLPKKEKAPNGNKQSEKKPEKSEQSEKSKSEGDSDKGGQTEGQKSYEFKLPATLLE